MYALTGFALLLGLAAIPMAVRGISSRIWRLHATVAIVNASALVVMAYVDVYHWLVPWWQVGAGIFAGVCLPVLAAGWAAREAARRWSRRRRLVVGLAGLVTLISVGAVGVGVEGMLLPDIINAEQ
jgi:hypothetical protein